MKTIWFDFTNPPHVNLYLPILRHLEESDKIICTARHFVETLSLLEQNGIQYKKFGEHGGKSKFMKLYAFAERDLKLLLGMPRFDVSISSNYEAPQVSWLRRKTSIVFDDNDISPNWLYAKFASHVICPEAINKDAMIRMGIKPKKLITYKGYKEDIYIANFKPDPFFLDKLPFKKFVTVRPENLFASYVTKGSKSIVPELIEKLTAKGINILYLPRYALDRSYVGKQENVYIPDSPLNGLDVCYYSDAVLTGAGTFSREASLMGTPAFSFFAGTEFLSVDLRLFSENRIFFSRKVDEIIEHLSGIQKKEPDLTRSIIVQKEVFGIVDKIVNR